MEIVSFSRMHINSRGRLLENNLHGQNKKKKRRYKDSNLRHLRVTVTVATDCATRPSAEAGTREYIDLLSVFQHISIYRSIHD